jgi:hypothetical protein
MSKRKDKGAKPPPQKMQSGAADARRAPRNVAHIRDKIAKALDDPVKREQLVRAVRSMMNEENS